MSLFDRHVHHFGKVDWGIEGECSCGVACRRMMGGYGYAVLGGHWWDDPEAALREQAELARKGAER